MPTSILWSSKINDQKRLTAERKKAFICMCVELEETTTTTKSNIIEEKVWKRCRKMASPQSTNWLPYTMYTFYFVCVHHIQIHWNILFLVFFFLLRWITSLVVCVCIRNTCEACVCVFAPLYSSTAEYRLLESLYTYMEFSTQTGAHIAQTNNGNNRRTHVFKNKKEQVEKW